MTLYVRSCLTGALAEVELLTKSGSLKKIRILAHAGVPELVKVKLFATLREIAGTRELDVEAKTLGEVLEKIAEKFGEDMRKLLFDERGGANKALIFVLNGERVRARPELELGRGDVLAIFPPVAGGISAGYVSRFLRVNLSTGR